MTNNIKIFLVGGAVRDTFLGTPIKDKDYVVVAPSFEAMKEFIVSKGGKIFQEKPEFLTLRARMSGFGTLGIGAADFVLARKDGVYTDGRRPDSVEVGTIEEDLARRDFTMNAIAIDTEDQFNVIDPFQGIDDIAHKLIRAVGDARTRLQEDKLRAFRALRFAVEKGFRIDNRLDWEISRLAAIEFAAVSTERIRDELLKMFKKDFALSIELLQDAPGLWEVVKQRGIWFKPTTEKL